MPRLTATHIVRHARRALLAVVLAGLSVPALAAEEARVIPAPAQDEAPSAAPRAVAVFAGGCFWGVQGVFQHVEGVTNAVSGYAGGEKSTAQYDRVSYGTTGHAEAVQVTYDPKKISYGRLMQIYFSVAHDPTQLNRQGPDTGTQYRSAIFPLDADQARLAKVYIAQLNQAKVFNSAIVTKIEPDRTFYPAEAYHQDFLTTHPTYPYIVINDLPKVESLKQLFPDVFREKPALVSAANAQN
ncbi:peptide-methionine (S)-S-oxide reductase MsrA [Aquabacter sp. CN5-332]|uniref:peptide-methionine (S)-S-oxide reductase MsrA n=1 Tax=Aquabacter sp. CN5-332 TaxID=3156608 RepID=UPI0032B56D66